MAITQLLSFYDTVLEAGGTYYIKQVNLANQNIKDVTEVYAIDNNDLGIIIKFQKSDDIESDFKFMVDNTTDNKAYFQYKNEILHLSSDYDYVPNTYSFYFVATRLATPIETLEDDIDIPNTLMPLFVNKALANLYHLQGKEAPLTIKRRIKELE